MSYRRTKAVSLNELHHIERDVRSAERFGNKLD